MAGLPHATGPGTTGIVLDALGIPVSGLLVEPSSAPPRAVVLALHGAGMRAGYFDRHAEPGHSLMGLGAGLGFTVLAVDRPGYGDSAAFLPEGAATARQAVLLRAALRSFARQHATGDGFFVVAHSTGGKAALALAAQDRDDAVIGLDVSGLGSTPAPRQRQLRDRGRVDWHRHWGAPGLYPPETFRLVRPLLAPTPSKETDEFPDWPELYTRLASRVRVPVRFTFAEQEPWWDSDAAAVAALTAPLTSARVEVHHQPDAGHNISLGRTARSYHLRALAFLTECLALRGNASAPRPGHPGPAAADRRGGPHVHGPGASS
ncbi:alpha/beta hydrolase [Streptomyces sp. NPDC056796]|uniref:alpha/beta hydrolase n=1 Tax=Streptomyces sp. NPDC056796 TaxID=3345947 RepID=UPI00367CF525